LQNVMLNLFQHLFRAGLFQQANKITILSDPGIKFRVTTGDFFNSLSRLEPFSISL